LIDVGMVGHGASGGKS